MRIAKNLKERAQIKAKAEETNVTEVLTRALVEYVKNI